jgi:hypothetical protein
MIKYLKEPYASKHIKAIMHSGCHPDLISIKNFFPPNQVMEKKQIFYGGISRKSVLDAYNLAIQVRKQENVGQRTISRIIKRDLDLDISENTISSWIYIGIIPFANEQTQFKAKEIPPKIDLEKLYLKQKKSASQIAEIYNVSTVTVINWINQLGIKLRSHLESMNTQNVKRTLAKKQLKNPTKQYNFLSLEKAYLFGVLCGDGYINEKSIKLEIRKDKEFIKEFEKCLESVYGLNYNHIYYQKRNTLLLAISSMLISKDLRTHGTFRTHTWQVPKEIANSNNEELIGIFLRGLYDSDGSVGHYNVNITSASYNGLLMVSHLLLKMGIDNHFGKNRKYFTIRIYKRKNIQKFKEKVGFTILRKMQKFDTMYKTNTEWK